jgi:AAA+ superfamily predicted ATPase
MARVILTNRDGRHVGELVETAEDLLARAEDHALQHHLAKRSYFPLAIRDAIESAGYRVSEAELALTMKKLHAVRCGAQMESVTVGVTPGDLEDYRKATHSKEEERYMSTKLIAPHRFFEAERVYPNSDARAWYDRLVGLDDHKRQLLLELELLLYPDRLIHWSRKHHHVELSVCRIMASRAPLLLLEGDVGCGKTALAETVGDPLAERTRDKVHLLKVNTQVRGTGMVGEMTDLIVQAFVQAETRADALKGAPLLLLIDEADALAATRTEQHMHHEDKAGLNTLLQRIDGLRLGKRRIVVLFITNRPDALDPAIRRRAALHLTFARPDDEVRAKLFRQSFSDFELTPNQVKELVKLTGHDAEKRFGAIFTFSDLTDRLLPAALRDAYAGDRALTADDLINHAKEMKPTPLMNRRAIDGE